MVIQADAESAKATLEDIPFWFHTFAIETDGDRSYTPGMARDHRYRLPALPEDYTGMSVLDIGAFDGFYAFLAESRGADYVLAVDNEQYRDWIASRWGAELEGGEGFAAIAGLLDSNVDYRTLDAFDLDQVDATFDLVLCFGILHRVENPLGLLRILARRTAEGGRVLLETHGSSDHGPRWPARGSRARAGRHLLQRRLGLLGLHPGQPRHAGAPRGLRRLRADRRPDRRRAPAADRRARHPRDDRLRIALFPAV